MTEGKGEVRGMGREGKEKQMADKPGEVKGNEEGLRDGDISGFHVA